MDVLLSVALQELAVEGSEGCSLTKLWSILKSADNGAEIIANGRSKQLLWQELTRVPGICLRLPNSVDVTAADPRVLSVEAAEKLGLSLIVPTALRDSSLGMYDLKVCDARLSTEQRKVLECIAKSRSKGITQSQLAKEFKIPGNKMFYLVRMLEVRGLVVRQATLVRTADGNSESFKHPSIVATNLLHLTRFAKDRTLSSHQRFEILNPSEDASGLESNIPGDMLDGKSDGKDLIIKDDLPAMQAVCQKLEETEGKVLVVSDLKSSLGYRMAVGHRTWRRLVKRLQDAGLVEILNAQIEQKVRSCIRLVKSFDAKDFKTPNEETDNAVSLKCAKRGQVTDMVTEVPIDHQIFDIVDRSGLEGVHMIEVFNNLGLQNKRNYYRIASLLDRRFLVSEAENHKRSTLYRLKTAKNVHGLQRPSGFSCGEQTKVASPEQFPSSKVDVNCAKSIVPKSLGLTEESGECALQKEVTLSLAERKAKGSARRALREARMSKEKNKQVVLWQDTIDLEQEPQAEQDMQLVSTEVETNAVCPTDSLDMNNHALALESSESPLALCMIPHQFSEVPSTSNLPLSTTRVQREKRMMEKLQAEKFILRVELHRWLEELENRKNVMMDRKTLSRILQGLQVAGQCKCVLLSMPGLTNCGRLRTIEVVMLPSVVVDPELLRKVHEQVRKFDMVSRGHGVARKKPKDSVPVLTGVPRMHTAQVKKITKFDKQTEAGPSMQANGFIPAKMVRVRMLHYFLWGYVNSLPEESQSFPDGSDTSRETVGSYKKFGLANSVHAMPLELFLQIIGSFHKFEHVNEWCKQGLRLCDLPEEDFSRLLDSNATGRLSWLVDVLRRLQLVRLVMGCVPAMQLDRADDPGKPKPSLAAVLTYAMEREPYLEEPAPAPLPSMNIDTYDLSPRARHEFSIVNKDGLDAYWQNLEYFFSGAQAAVARHAFPGSNVLELFGLRSWASLRVMSLEKRTELMKRVGDGGIDKRKPWHECVMIAKELDLSLQQVLRVSYEKNRICRLQTLQKAGKILKKRKVVPEDLGESAHAKAYKKQQQENVEKEVPKSLPSHSNVEMGPHALGDDNDGDGDDDDDNEAFGHDGEQMNDFSYMSSVRPSRYRMRRFVWSERLDRLLIASYARQRAQLGARYHRVDWDSMVDLPAPPQTCRRRMAQLRLDLGVRKALMSLCSLLTLRHINHSKSQGRNCSNTAASSCVTSGAAAPVEDSQLSTPHCGAAPSDSHVGTCNVDHLSEQLCPDKELAIRDGGQEYSWDDITEPFLAAALDEVIRCRAILKTNTSTRTNASRPKLLKGPYPASGSAPNAEVERTVENAARSSQDGSSAPEAGKLSVNLEAVAVAGCNGSMAPTLSWFGANSVGLNVVDGQEIARISEETAHKLNGPIPGRSLPSTGPTRRIRKRVQSTLNKSVGVQEITNEQLVQNSVAVANAVELVKLVLLNSSEGAQPSDILVDAVQRFKETEVISAIKYLRERGFLMAGQSAQNLVLTPKFFQDCSTSRFPVDIGNDFFTSEQWLCSHKGDIEQNWVSVPSEPQSGQLLHLFALVSTNEFSLTPSVPADNLGEMEENDSGKRKAFMLERRDSVRNVRARSLSSAVPHWSALRKERGYPGIKVSLVRYSTSLATVLDTFSKGSEGIGKEHVPEFCITTLAPSLTESDGVLDLSMASSVQKRLDPESGMPAVREDMTMSVTSTSDLNAFPDNSFGELSWDANTSVENQNPVIVSDASPSSSHTMSKESTWSNCIMDWDFETRSNSAAASDVQVLKPDFLHAAYCAIEQAGDNGLNLEQLVSLQTSGIDTKYDIKAGSRVVHALEASGCVKRVNAYNQVRVVATSQSTRYFLHISRNDGWESDEKSFFGHCIPVRDKQASLCGEFDATSWMNSVSHPGNTPVEAASHVPTRSAATPKIVGEGGDHRIITLRQDGERVDSNTEYVAILPWLNQNGTTNEYVLKGLTRRVMGLVALHPGISEDTLVEQINVLNPQSARQLLLILELDGHLLIRSIPGPQVAAPPKLLANLVSGKINFKETTLQKHFFINPLASRHL